MSSSSRKSATRPASKGLVFSSLTVPMMLHVLPELCTATGEFGEIAVRPASDRGHASSPTSFCRVLCGWNRPSAGGCSHVVDPLQDFILGAREAGGARVDLSTAARGDVVGQVYGRMKYRRRGHASGRSRRDGWRRGRKSWLRRRAKQSRDGSTSRVINPQATTSCNGPRGTSHRTL